MSNTLSNNTMNKSATPHGMSSTENVKAEGHTTRPGELQVIKRTGQLVDYDDSHISTALKLAFIAVEKKQDKNPLPSVSPLSQRIQTLTEMLTRQITETFHRHWPTGGTIHIEMIQDQVELALMRAGEHAVARAYVLYREARRQQRLEAQGNQTPTITTTLCITGKNGDRIPLDTQWLAELINTACKNVEHVAAEPILKDTLQNVFDGIRIEDLYKASILATRPLIEQEPNYSYVGARLLLLSLVEEVSTILQLNYQQPLHQVIDPLYKQVFKTGIQYGIGCELLNPELATFDLERLAAALQPERDHLFTFLGLQTLYDRYFLHHSGMHIELPQTFFMRVAMGLAIAETQDRDGWAIRFYDLLSSHTFMSSTPTLFNSGTCRPQLSSCFLTTVPDDLDGIYSAIKDNALLSKYAGGLGNDWTPVRAIGAHIKGTNGKSLGVVPFLNVADATAIAVNQGGKRKGAVCAYLETWHMDIEEFLELRKNTGDERRRTHDMNTANWIPDLFMKRVFEDGEWTLFSPDEVPLLHDLYGAAFEKAYVECENLGRTGKIRSKTLRAVGLWRKMLGMLFETGHPWMTFKDPCNLRSPQQHVGVIHSSNLCTEITLNTSKTEIAVCNLGSINLLKHMSDKGLDQTKLQNTIQVAVRMLDNVIDINYYTVPQARNSNLKHRPIGLGLMGFQDALHAMKIPYASQEAVEFADRSMEAISYYAIQASCELAAERGQYESYPGSLWSQGILPIDSIQLLQKNRGEYLTQDLSTTLDWNQLRESVRTIGMRNSNVMAIAPTATISNICGVSQSIEPTYQNLFVKSNMSGEFTVINPFLVQDLKELELWDSAMIHDLKFFNGSLSAIKRIPQALKTLYATAFEVEPRWLVEAASRRQKWLDQAQSLNLYMAEPSGRKLDVLYRMAWVLGLKTTYYLRSMGATNAEKATIHDGALNAVSMETRLPPAACSINDPSCEACQ